MTEVNPLEEFVLRYRDDPVLFVTEWSGEKIEVSNRISSIL